MNKYALITGASSGIGYEFSKQLASLGYNLIVVARRLDKLNQLKEEVTKENKELDVIVINLDLSIIDNCQKLMEQIKNKEIEIFINNAGFGYCEEFIQTPLEKEISMIDLNVKSMHILLKEVLNLMIKRNSGYILNVASSAGLMPAGPYMSTYYATKSYVTSLTRGINFELKEKKIPVYVGTLCPGPVDTEFSKSANVKFSLKGISSEKCVAYTLKKMWKKKILIVPTFKMKVAVTLGRFISQKSLIKTTAKQQKKKM